MAKKKSRLQRLRQKARRKNNDRKIKDLAKAYQQLQSEANEMKKFQESAQATVNDIKKISNSFGKQAQAKLNDLYNNMYKSDYYKSAKLDKVPDNLTRQKQLQLAKQGKAQELAKQFKDQAKRIASSRAYAADSFNSSQEFDPLSYKNLMTTTAVMANKDLGVKVNKGGGSYNERPTYKVDYSNVPKEKKAQAKAAIRRAKRNLAKHGESVFKLMGMIKKVYGSRVIEIGSDQVYQAVIDYVEAHPGLDPDSDEIGDSIDEIMEIAKSRSKE